MITNIVKASLLTSKEGEYIDVPKRQEKRKLSAQEIRTYIQNNQFRLLRDIREDGTLPRYIKRLLHFIKYRTMNKIEQRPTQMKQDSPLPRQSRCEKRRQRAALRTQILSTVDHISGSDEELVVNLGKFAIDEKSNTMFKNMPKSFVPKHSTRDQRVEFCPIVSSEVEELELYAPPIQLFPININIGVEVSDFSKRKAMDLLERMSKVGYTSLEIVGCLQTDMAGSPCEIAVTEENAFSTFDTFLAICSNLFMDYPYEFRFSKKPPYVPPPTFDLRKYKSDVVDLEFELLVINELQSCDVDVTFKMHPTVSSVASYFIHSWYKGYHYKVGDILSGKLKQYNKDITPIYRIAEKVPGFSTKDYSFVSMYYNPFRPVPNIPKVDIVKPSTAPPIDLKDLVSYDSGDESYSISDDEIYGDDGYGEYRFVHDSEYDDVL